MKQTVIYPALSAILSGLVLSAIAFYLFTNRPVDLTQGMSIKHFGTEVNALAIKDIVKTFAPEIDFDDIESSKLFYEKFGYSNDVNISIYNIDNQSDKVIPSFKIALGRFHRAYLTNDQSFDVLRSGRNEIDQRILPRSSLVLLVFSIYTPIFPQERFLINGKEVPVLSLSGRFGGSFLSDNYSFIEAYAITIAIIFTIGLGAIFILLMAAALFIFTINNPEYLVKTADNWLLVRSLTIINLIRYENTDRFAAIVRKSEKLFAKWNRSDADKQEEAT
ncbi:hypothetical protein [Chelativorans sp. M5D2P16]|uniref:hypothetical protein n=1 Tax=Chelativorans sp. M5D2P16 TaxID=3095678 RepID=UPI002ACAF26C|nr:hypothetical protein [Chelativorans sp. M5D2P16]MDZ5696687.1 hypothetical protein [Chelativorans sp. M5D2P16]